MIKYSVSSFHLLKVGEYLVMALELALDLQKQATKLVDFCVACEKDVRTASLKEQVNTFARSFEMFGFSGKGIVQ